MRYGDGVIDKRRNRMICIREDHTVLQKGYAVTEIVALDLDGQKEPVVLLSYPDDSESDYLRDFYSSPCLSPDGEKLAWLAWNFGRMPWDSNELWVAEFDKNGLLDREKIKKIAGNTNELEKGESLFQPQWWQNKLYYVSDRDKWWHIYRHNDDGDEKISKNAPKDVEFAAPQWNLRMSTYSFLTEDTIIAAYNKSGIWKLGEINTETFVFKELPITFPVETEDPKFKEVTEIKQVRVCSGKVVFIAGGPYFPSSIVRLSEERTQMAVIQRGTRIDLFNKSPESKEPLYNYISKYEPVSYETSDPVGSGKKKTAFALYYPPCNPKFTGPNDQYPPLVIKAHGGPTGAASAELDMTIQYFTSRGIGVVDVNYRGSTGYGRSYRLSLYNNFGIYDRDDCVNCVNYLSDTNKIDKNRVVARGGSAGGYLTLVLATFTHCCKGVASYYGISNLETLAMHTHKFESYYAYELVGPIDSVIKTFKMRSPYYNIQLLDCPMIFFQGKEDKVVPPEQAEQMVEALKEKGKPVAFLLFDHEQHGFRIAENIKKALEAELYFYSRILGFEPADTLEPIPISNWLKNYEHVEPDFKPNEDSKLLNVAKE